MMLQGEDDQESVTPPPSQPPNNIQPILTHVTKFNLHTKGEFLCYLNSVPTTMMADTGSARNLVSDHTLALVMGEFYLNYLEKKAFKPILDCNSKPLRILGALQLKVAIGKLCIEAEFLCYQGSNKTALLGFLTMHEEHLVVYPRLGLFVCHQSLDNTGDACFSATDPQQHVAVETQELLLPVAARVHLNLAPGQCANVAAEVLLPAVTPADQKVFSYATFVFHSEKLQQYLPLDKISCYYQYQCLNHDTKVILRYCNHTKEIQSIYPGQVIAHAQELEECSDDLIRQSGDDILKFVFSIFRPDVHPDNPADKDQKVIKDEKGKPSPENCQIDMARDVTNMPRVRNSATIDLRHSDEATSDLRDPNATPRTHNHATYVQQAYGAASRVPNHATSSNRNVNGPSDASPRATGTQPTQLTQLAQPHQAQLAQPARPQLTARHRNVHSTSHAPRHATTQHQPSLLSSKASTPYTYKTGLHELKGPTELEGGYKESDIKIESSDPEERAFIYDMYRTYQDAVSQHEYDAGTYVGGKISFTLKKGTQTYHAKPYPIPSHLKPQADALINQLVAAGIVDRTTAPAVHIAPLHFVVKAFPDLPAHLARYPGEKDTSKPRKLRAVINHRVLNACVELPTRFPQAQIPDILRRMHAATVASTTDLRASFYALQMHPDVYPYMAFEYANELWYFRRCPMGFVMSSFALNAATQHMKVRYALTQCEFMADDCIIWGVDANDYRAQVRKFFAALAATGFKLHPTKSTWWVRADLPVLGFILNLPCKSLLASQQKIKSLMTTTQPKTKREIRRFIGAVSFLSHFIFGLQQLLRPLHTAASPKVPFMWSRECDFCWRTILRSLATLPALKLPSPRFPLDLHTDGSPKTKRSLNWVWCQKQHGKTYLVQFGSRCLAKEHLALSQPELEMLCLLSALQTDSHLVAYSSLNVHTDAKGLTFLATYENSQSKLRRWTLFLQSLPLTVCFTRNTSALIRLTDFLGRQRHEVVQAMKIKKPLAKDCVVFPTYNLEGIAPLPFQHCWALLKEVVDLQKKAQLDVGYPLLPYKGGEWRPLDGLLEYHTTTAQDQQKTTLHFLPAARCSVQRAPAQVPAPRGRTEKENSLGSSVLDKVEDKDENNSNDEFVALARPPQGSAMLPHHKVADWKVDHWANAHLLPSPPNLSSSSLYNLSKAERVRHHLPSLHHQSLYTNPSLILRQGPLLLHKYEISNLNDDEKQPALRFLLAANAELRGLPLLSVRKQQEEDPVYAPIITKLKQGAPVKGFALFQGLLLQVKRQPSLKLTVVLPQQLGIKFLASLHESTSLFHLQASTIVRLAKRYFTIPQMSKLALQVTQDCLQCQLYNRQSHQAAVRGKRFTLSAPRQLLYSDVCTFFTNKTNKSYLVIVDGFSYLTSAYTLVTPETSDQIASHLIHYFSSHTAPSGICLDHASVHEGILAQALSLLNIKKYQCSSRYPQPNLAERVHQYIIRVLSLLSSSFTVQEIHLPCLVSFALHVFNGTPLRSMGDRSPYAIHYGDQGNATASVPTIHVAPGSSLPSYVKALARLQAATWQAVNDIKRKKERKHLKGGNPLREPLFRPGDCVRMKTNTLATAKNHKLVEKYSKHIYKVIKVLKKSGNYILLKLSDKNYLTHGFHTKQPLPKNCLTWAKEHRLKKCSFMTACPDTLTGKLFALFSQVAFQSHPVPQEFHLDPQRGQVVAADKQLLKLSKFVLGKDAPRPQRSPLQSNILLDSDFGKISGSVQQQSCSQDYLLRGANPPSGHQHQHKEGIPYDNVISRILPPHILQLHRAAGCDNSVDGDSVGGEEPVQTRAAAAPVVQVAAVPQPVQHAAPAAPYVQQAVPLSQQAALPGHRQAGGSKSNAAATSQAAAASAAPTLPPDPHPAGGGARPKTTLSKQAQLPHSHRQPQDPHLAQQQTEQPLEFYWDNTYDFPHPTHTSSPAHQGTRGANANIANWNRGDSHEQSEEGDPEHGTDQGQVGLPEEEEEDVGSFHSTRASSGGSHGSRSSSEERNSPPLLQQQRQVPPATPQRTPPTPPTPQPILKRVPIRYITESADILDLQSIPSGQVLLHGHHTFGNTEGVDNPPPPPPPQQTNTVKLVTAAAETTIKTKTKTSKPSVSGTRVSLRTKRRPGEPPPPPAGPP